MAVGVAHDFNNLLASVAGNNKIVLRRAELDPELTENLRQIQESAEQAVELTGKVLIYSGRAPLDLQPVNLSALLRELEPSLGTLVPDAVHIECRVRDDVPPVEGDRQQIRQLVVNLVANAGEAIVDREGAVTVSTGIEECDRATLDEVCSGGAPPEGQYVFIEVSDPGSGIPEHVQPKIFDPFFSTKIRGQGLGLAVAFGVARGHGAAIKVKTTPGKGSTFRVLFPCLRRTST